MKKTQFILLGMLFSVAAAAQNNATYGLVRKNYYSTVTDPFDPMVEYEQLDSATVRLGSIDPTNGFVTNIGPAFTQIVNLTGSAINPYDSTYIFIGGGLQLQTLDLTSGMILNSVTISNPINDSYFDNFRFNNSDSTLYGLARRSFSDPLTSEITGEVYLAKINTSSGVITQLSQNSVAQGYAMAGSAIDPHQMVYYFSSGAQLIGLDLYNGEIHSNELIQIPGGGIFDNFAYSCADTTIYGLVRKNYFSFVEDPLFPGEFMEQLDSSTVRLGRINPSTGMVTVVSPSVISMGGYSLNAGAAIDQNEMIYYYSNGSQIIGVSLLTGMVVSTENVNFENGQYIDLMRNLSDCAFARAVRLNEESLSLDESTLSSVKVFPNPSNELCTITCSEILTSVKIFDAAGKQVFQQLNCGTEELQIDLSLFENGWYTLMVNESESIKLVVMH